jgi:hypothetical protein
LFSRFKSQTNRAKNPPVKFAPIKKGAIEKSGILGNLMVRLGHQFQYFEIDNEKTDTLPNQRGPHVAGKAGGSRRVISLLVRLSVGNLAWHVLLLKVFVMINLG